jgi:general secretion pathway protein D
MRQARCGRMLLPRGLRSVVCLGVFLVLIAVPCSSRSQPGGGTATQSQGAGAVPTNEGSGDSKGDLSTQQQVSPPTPSGPAQRVLSANQASAPGAVPTPATPPPSAAQVTLPVQQGTPPGSAAAPVPPRPSRRLAPTQQAPAPTGRPTPPTPSQAGGEVSSGGGGGKAPEAGAEPSRPQRRASMHLSGDRNISMDFDQADIKTFIKFISELTGKNFVVDEKVRGKVTVFSPSKISVEEAYRVFESVLEVNNLTTIPGEKVNKVVPSVEARQKSVETRKETNFIPRPDDRIITQIKPLAYADSQEIRKVLAPLVSREGVVVAYEPTDILIITDYQSNIQRVLKIIDELDVQLQESVITVMPLQYASADKLADKILKLVETKQRAGRGRATGAPQLKVVPEERINALIVLADRQTTQMIEDLVKTLDQTTPRGGGNIQVVRLENALAEDLAKVLLGLPTKQPAEKGKEPTISTEVKIAADKATNSLVITAKPEEFVLLEGIIKQLDTPRKQVFVEALFMEVTATKDLSLGVNWNVAGTTNLPYTDRDALIFGGSNPNALPSLINSSTGIFTAPNGFAVGAVGFPFKIGDVTISNLAALIQAAQSDTKFNIIATPQIMTLDNQEASVVVAENIPYSTRLDLGTSTTDRAIQQFEYKDVGVTLKVTPQINESRFVKLKIMEEVSKVVSQQTVEGLLAPTTRKRKAETIVEVKDGETVVIAGLIGEDNTSSRSSVPCLGDVPLVGWLFQSLTKNKQPTNLFVFLTPHIVANPQEAGQIYRETWEHIDDLGHGGKGTLKPEGTPSVPPPPPSMPPAAAPAAPQQGASPPASAPAPQEGVSPPSPPAEGSPGG